MFSGKSGAVVEVVKRRLIGGQIAGKDFVVFSHQSDNRYGEGIIASHNHERVVAIPRTTSLGIMSFLLNLPENMPDLHPGLIKPELKNVRSLIVDEGQFFDGKLGRVLTAIDTLWRLMGKNLEITVAGLNLDFRGEPFPTMADVLSRAEKVNVHVAVCHVCGENNATMTQRLVDGQPAKWSDPVKVVGADELYTARCKQHHEVFGKPILTG